MIRQWLAKRRATEYKRGYDWAFGTLMDGDKVDELSMLLWYGSGIYVNGARQALLDWNGYIPPSRKTSCNSVHQ